MPNQNIYDIFFSHDSIMQIEPLHPPLTKELFLKLAGVLGTSH